MAPFVAKFGPSGALRWSHTLVSAWSRSPPTLALDAAGNVSIAVEYMGPIDFGGGPLSGPTDRANIAIAQYGAAGSLRWSSRVARSPRYVGSPSLGTSRSGELILGGEYQGKLRVAGDTLIGDPVARDVFVAKLAR
ncbi:hypothetical protein WMF37_38160 [Sorangium sp. So ce291]|uniref:hypothetical protein n=1 Tax=Sorangium sp. So ce291 TaxID=3133294 RepID=UPI003F5FAFA1